MPRSPKLCHHLRRVRVPPPNILGIWPVLSLIISDSLEKLFIHVLSNSYVCFQLPEVPQEVLVPLDKAEIFEPILASVLRNNCTSSCCTIACWVCWVLPQCEYQPFQQHVTIWQKTRGANLSESLLENLKHITFFVCASALYSDSKKKKKSKTRQSKKYKKNIKKLSSNYHTQYLSKQVAPIIYRLEKRFVSCLFLFRQSKNTFSILPSTWVFFKFSEKRRPNKHYLWEIIYFSTCR